MRIFISILFLGILPVLNFAQAEPKTVTDFYLALPETPSEIKGSSKRFDDDFSFAKSAGSRSKTAIVQHRKSLIKIADLKNGYLRLEGTWEGWAEIALFKKADGEYVVAFSQVGCGPGCSGRIIFLTYRDHTWKDVTDQVFPVNSIPDEGYFKLPRVGTTIELICGDPSNETCQEDKKLAEFKWNKTRFVE